jgi:hypothetical protein
VAPRTHQMAELCSARNILMVGTDRVRLPRHVPTRKVRTRHQYWVQRDFIWFFATQKKQIRILVYSSFCVSFISSPLMTVSSYVHLFLNLCAVICFFYKWTKFWSVCTTRSCRITSLGWMLIFFLSACGCVLKACTQCQNLNLHVRRNISMFGNIFQSSLGSYFSNIWRFEF